MSREEHPHVLGVQTSDWATSTMDAISDSKGRAGSVKRHPHLFHTITYMNTAQHIYCQNSQAAELGNISMEESQY